MKNDLPHKFQRSFKNKKLFLLTIDGKTIGTLRLIKNLNKHNI